jgi:hypothetical protein
MRRWKPYKFWRRKHGKSDAAAPQNTGNEVKRMATNCEECVHYDYDDEVDAYFCSMDLDEDEMERFLRSANNACPFYRRGDDYRTARRQ